MTYKKKKVKYWVDKKVSFAFFRKFPRKVEEVLEGSVLRIYIGNTNIFRTTIKLMDMNVDLELEMKISCRELRWLLAS